MVKDEFITKKDRFSDEQWKLLRHLVYLTFTTIAASDRAIDEQEINVLLSCVKQWIMNNEPLHRQLFKSIGELEGEGSEEYKELLTQLQANPWMGPDTIERAKALLKGELSPEEYQRFFGWLMIFGLWVAKASGPIGEEEAKALTTFNHHFEVDPLSLQTNFAAYEEVEELVGYRLD